MGEINFRIGDPVAKVGGDYRFEGKVAGIVRKKSGQIRYVVEDDRGLLFIFNPAQLEPRTILLTVAPPANRRTRARVLWERANLRGCCDKYADRKACDCLATAQPDCSICRDPRCQEPGGKH